MGCRSMVRAALAAGMLVPVVGLVGCGANAGTWSGATPTPSASASSVDPQALSAEFNKLPFTKPGTKLKLGQDALVRFEDSSDNLGAVKIRLVSITKGSQDDPVMQNLQHGVGHTPWYLTWQVTGDVASFKLTGSPTDWTMGWLNTRDFADYQTSYGLGKDELPQCPMPDVPEGFDKGVSYTTCSVAFSGKSTEKVVGGAWVGSTPTVLGGPSGMFGDDPIIWQG